MDQDYGKVILKALAEIRRNQILAAKFNPATEDMYSDAFAHAVLHRIYPFQDEGVGFMSETSEILNVLPFYEAYDVGRELVEEIAELLHEKWRAKKKITFYDVEGPYKLEGQPWKGVDARTDLINICRYFYLAHMFDDKFWKVFMSDAPSEAGDMQMGQTRNH
jgi:hypothetical protein